MPILSFKSICTLEFLLVEWQLSTARHSNRHNRTYPICSQELIFFTQNLWHTFLFLFVAVYVFRVFTLSRVGSDLEWQSKMWQVQDAPGITLRLSYAIWMSYYYWTHVRDINGENEETWIFWHFFLKKIWRELHFQKKKRFYVSQNCKKKRLFSLRIRVHIGMDWIFILQSSFKKWSQV